MFVTCNTKNRIIRRPKKTGRQPVERLYDERTNDPGFAMLTTDIRNLTVPHGAHGAYAFKYEYLKQQVFSKYTDPFKEPSAGPSRAELAIAKMLRTEDNCRIINKYGYDIRMKLPTGYLAAVMHYACAEVAKVLGCFTYDCLAAFRFSGGASTSKKRSVGHPYYKYADDEVCDVTRACEKYAIASQYTIPLWYNGLVQNAKYYNIVRGNHVTTVPKNSKIDRVIAMEPDLNMAHQLSVGKYIRGRLREVVGIDLNDQTNNQRYAKIGSIDGSFATIDLSSASDSISYRLVADLLPFDWYSLLDDLRSPYGRLPDGREIRWEKFSSMGNGYTFELETLLFYALCKGVAVAEGAPKSKILVYGDDIIVPTSIANNVIAVLEAVGFKTNDDKTFTTGRFRESCGKHYYEGTDVSPFYVRRPITTWTDYINVLNKLRAWAYCEHVDMLDSNVYDLWTMMKRRVPRRLRGGKSTDVNTSLCTPGKVRDRLVPRYKRVRSLNGWRLLLAILQNKHDTDDPLGRRFVRILDESSHLIYHPTPDRKSVV